MKPGDSKRFARWLVPACVVVAAVTSAAGLLIDVTGFLGNLLSEIAGICAGIVVGLLIVDKYAQHQREQQWAKVRDLTYAAIVGHLCDITTEMLLLLPSEGSSAPNVNSRR